MRDGFKSGILERAKRDETFHVLTGDHGYALFDEFASLFPDRFHNVGIAESNLIGLAAGMARNGLTPLVYGLAAFIPNRVFEFIKLQIAAESLPVTIVGDGAGLVYSTLGISHQTLEDLAIMGSLPSVVSLSPGSNKEMNISVNWAGDIKSPVYIRMGKSDGIYEGSSIRDSPAPHLVHRSGSESKKTIIAHGSMVSQAIGLLAIAPKSFDIWSCPTIFPLDAEFTKNLEREYEEIVVIEEHGIHGGLGSQILQSLSQKVPKIHLFGASLRDERTVGSWDWALRFHDLDNEAILRKLREIGFVSQ